MTRSRAARWALIIILLLISWGLRLVRLEEVPPGWRDDELINIHALSSQVLNGRIPLYYVGASGHEPLYHHLHAGVHALLGFNVLSGHILSVMFGTLSIALTYSLVRRLFPKERSTALITSFALGTSFWSLMYSRTAIRHISLPPFLLATLYVFWRQMSAEESTPWGWGLTGLLLGMSLYTYTASRLLPVLLIVFAGYLALFHRELLAEHWRGLALTLTLTALLATPLGLTIARNRSQYAIEGIGADARVTELAEPVRALQDGDPGPVIQSTMKTLGMFHSTGDPEWLYNIPGRPVFNHAGGALLWAGVIVCLYRWREPRYFLLLPWLGLGLSPAFISTPPSSLGHTILAQPAVYILPALVVIEIRRILRLRVPSVSRVPLPALGTCALALLFVVSNGIRDLESYFGDWPQEDMVRLLYRADYRDIANYLNDHPELTDLTVASALLGPWDRLALDVDTGRGDVDVRLFDPRRALIWTGDQRPSWAMLTSWPEASSEITTILESHTILSETLPSNLRLHELAPVTTGGLASLGSCLPSSEDHSAHYHGHRFGNGMELVATCWLDEGTTTRESESALLAEWVVAEPLDLPPIPIVANPPPPRTYAGPRLAVFAHLSRSDAQAGQLNQLEASVVGDDGLWVDPLTLRPGDRFIQIHRFDMSDEGTPGPYVVRLGLYDPMTGRRWAVVDSEGTAISDHIVVGGEDPP